MSIFINNQIHNNQSLLSILFGKKNKSAAVGRNTNCGKRDTVVAPLSA